MPKFLDCVISLMPYITSIERLDLLYPPNTSRIQPLLTNPTALALVKANVTPCHSSARNILKPLYFTWSQRPDGVYGTRHQRPCSRRASPRCLLGSGHATPRCSSDVPGALSRGPPPPGAASGLAPSRLRPAQRHVSWPGTESRCPSS